MNNWVENHGYLELIIGPMYSGKTSRLINIYNQCVLSNINVFVINHSSDTRYDAKLLTSHNQEKIPCYQTDSLSKFTNDILSTKSIKNNAVILVNEGQFFTDLKENILYWVEELNLRVYVAGLDSDFKREKFGQINDIIPFCDQIEKLYSFCSKCQNGTRAIFSHRLTNEQSQVVIGSDNYLPLCRKCYIKTI